MAISANARAVGTIKNYLGTAMNSFAKYLAEAKVSFPEFVRTGFTEAHLAAFAMWMCAEHKSTTTASSPGKSFSKRSLEPVSQVVQTCGMPFASC